ncbi:MAG: GNAT family N-acetyltransferase [Thermoplasmata archaeon]|nr:GNAT family N-acetyltransferase [Thermoplasmata archaeon]
MELRTLSSADYDAIVGVWDRAGLPYRPKGRDSRPEIERQMAIDPEMWLGCFMDGKLAGVVLGTHESRKGWLNRLAVVPEHQGKGCGRALVNEMEKRLRARGLGIFAVLIEDGHDASMALFKKAGYEVHENITYLRKRDNQDI